ncbi:hypothetical protein NA57DRAFT_81108 [Rhizodiscina lignyota]|uniref:Uncharacterized protein n=1 Tax=Rhizodiscina lignyota TaxID=1504668 RepID=A0A9P4I242_9PEZI|nr:hypothetical protein NA57DRAFT_81108 [Rhizodiscina lignyota]
MAEALSITAAVANIISTVQLAARWAEATRETQDQTADAQKELWQLQSQLQQAEELLLQYQQRIPAASGYPGLLFNVKFDQLDRDEAQAILQDLQDVAPPHGDTDFEGQKHLDDDVADGSFEMQRLQRKNRVLSGSLNEQAGYIRKLSDLSRPKWILAEHDYPQSELAWNCPQTRNPKVLVYDPQRRILNVQSQDQLGNKGAIVSRLPSRLPKALHVYVESQATAAQSYYRVRVTNKRRHVDGLLYDRTIFLRNLNFSTKLQIMTGSIHWLFILRSAGDYDHSIADSKSTLWSRRSSSDA